MVRFSGRAVRRVGVAATMLLGMLSDVAPGQWAARTPYRAGRSAYPQSHGHHHDHYHGGSYDYRPGFSFSIGSGGSYYGASSGIGFGPGFSAYSGPAFGGPLIYPPLFIDQFGNFEGYGGYGYGYGGYAGYGVPYGYGVTSPYAFPQYQDTIDRAPIPSGAFNLPLDQNQAGQVIGRDPLNVRPSVQTHPRLVKPSTPDAQLRALRLQDMGDQQMRALRYANAAQAYEKAIETAQDVPDPYFRLGLAFIGKGRLVEAATTFEEAAALDPQLPWRAPKLDDILGVENRLAKGQLKDAVVQWANNEVRDTRRLFLLGVIMHLDNDPRAREIFESASRIGGSTPGLQAFLNAPADGSILGPNNLATPVQPRGNPVPNPPQPQLTPPSQLNAPGALPPAPMPSTIPPAPQAQPPLPRSAPAGEPQPTPAEPGSGVVLPIPVAPAPAANPITPSSGTIEAPPLLVPPVGT